MSKLPFSMDTVYAMKDLIQTYQSGSSSYVYAKPLYMLIWNFQSIVVAEERSLPNLVLRFEIEPLNITIEHHTL